MLLLLSIILSIGSVEAAESNDLAFSLELSELPLFSISAPEEKIQTVCHKIFEGSCYFGAGTALKSASFLARLGWGICQISPWASTAGNECILLSQMCNSAAEHLFAQMLRGSPPSTPFFTRVPISQWSWHLNQTLLSQIPALSKEEQQLLHFLEQRWLAKSTGFFSSVINWVYPCFGVSIQVHPETTSCYSRDPSIKFSQTYKNRVEDWKESLPHPKDFPLILTRPFELQGYLPFCLEVPQDEKIQTTVERTALKMQKTDTQVIVDLTHVFTDNAKDRKKWLQTWKAYCQQFSQACKERHLSLNQILCIQRIQQEDIGGIRLLPLVASSTEDVNLQHQYLLHWISTFGLSANRIELDRWTFSSNIPIREHSAPPLLLEFQSKEEFIFYLDSFDQNWKSVHPQKTLMCKGTMQVLKGLFNNLSEEKWGEI
ncbi:MAG TPA: hypothetical protein VIJ14_09730, partial [Rhabdochlamydiaceae bacterium]